MAEALMKGFVSSGQADWSRIVASDPNPPRREAMSALGVTVKDNVGVAASSDVVFIATKPQQVAEVLREIAGTLYSSGALVVSIAAGVTLNTMYDALVGAGNANAGISHVRVMPNTPCFVGETAAAMALSGGVSTAEKECVERLLSSVGKCHVVDEKLLDAVTGLSGSGPAYVFLTIEAMADGGVAAGLPRPVALSLAAQTVLGGAKMVLEGGKHPGELKDMVCSPGGTTIAGVHELEKAGVRAAYMNAVTAAARRSKELSKL
uniref:Pyrroline-5-carboxylate reductase n=1 Tax=Prasinoderma coloniale TaxID=156133 RepID=A0A7R9XVN8_9VIRI